MIRLFLSCVIVLLALLGSAVTAAALFGRTLDTDILTVHLVKPASQMGWRSPSQPYFQMTDVRRLVSLRILPPVSDLSDVSLVTTSDRYALLYTGKRATQDDRTQRLYLYDLRSGALTPLLGTRKDTGVYSGNEYAVSFSPQGDRLAFLDPSNAQIHLYNLVTGQRQQIGQGGHFTQTLEWSPDGTRIATRADNDLVVFNLTDQTERRIPLDFGSFTPIWMEDGRRIFLHSLNVQASPLRIVDTETGTIEPLNAHLAIGSTAWGCNDTRLVYGDTLTYAANGNQPTVQQPRLSLLDLTTGRETNLKDLPEFVERQIVSTLWLPDCLGLILVTINHLPLAAASSSSATPGTRTLTTLYWVDPDGQQARLLVDRAWFVSRTADGTIIYETVQDDVRSYYQLQIDGTPVELGRIAGTEGWTLWVDESGWVLHHSPGPLQNRLYSQPLTLAWMGGDGATRVTPQGDKIVSFVVWE